MLRNDAEKAKRVREYFTLLSRLENNLEQEVERSDFEIFEKMSGRATRMWYVTGCHMAQMIESAFGIDTLRQLVGKGCSDFFKTYMTSRTRCGNSCGSKGKKMLCCICNKGNGVDAFVYKSGCLIVGAFFESANS